MLVPWRVDMLVEANLEQSVKIDSVCCPKFKRNNMFETIT